MQQGLHGPNHIRRRRQVLDAVGASARRGGKRQLRQRYLRFTIDDLRLKSGTSRANRLDSRFLGVCRAAVRSLVDLSEKPSVGMPDRVFVDPTAVATHYPSASDSQV